MGKIKGINIDSEYLNNLRFADDIVLVEAYGEEIQPMINELNIESRKIGLGLIKNYYEKKRKKVIFSRNTPKWEQ